MRSHKLLLIVLTALTLASCRIQYAEQPTKAGSVQAPQPVAVIAPASEGGGATSVFDKGKDPVPFDSEKYVETGDESTIITGKSNIIETFKKKYNALGSPKIAIYLNKEISDEILEWERASATIHVDYEAQKSDFMDTKRVEGSADITAEIKLRNELYAKRENPPEAWMWNFEDEFINVFVRNGTKLVDRALMLRLEAAKSKETDETSRRKVEIDALKDKSDIIIEILIKRVPRSKLGVQFKATAKSVDDAVILAVANSFNWEERISKRKKKFVASEEGGYVEDTDTDDFPKVSEMSRYLALDMMDGLVEYWKNTK